MTATDNNGITWVPIGLDVNTCELLLVPLDTAVHRIPLADAEPAPEVIEGTVAGTE